MSNADSRRVRVLVADDHDSIRENLRYLLNAEDDLEVIGVAKDGADALRAAVAMSPDVLVLDNDMPAMDGFDVLIRLRHHSPAIGIVMYTAEVSMCNAALGAGAKACISKDSSVDELLAAIRAAPSTLGALGPQDLRDAIAQSELTVALQPLVEMRSRRAARVEALCRWTHRTLGVISPVRFIGMAEAHDLITPLTLMVVRTAAAQINGLRRERPDMRLSFNLSLATLLDPLFFGQLVQVLEQAGCDPNALGVEVTESMLMREPAATAAALTKLHGLGMRIDVDDFGTGYSSMGALIDLPIDAVKIDRRFVQSMSRDHKNEAVVRAVIALAHDLGLEAVAEGIEDRETWDLLMALGCDTAQGYYIGVPLPSSQIGSWLAAWENGSLAGESRGVEVRQDRSKDDVLVVDDDPAIVEIIRDVLEHEGFRVVTAANGAEALRALERRVPAVILLDMQMPIVDGASFTRTVRQRGMDVPIVVMTAGSSAARWARELPVDAYLSKPFEIDGLVEIAGRFAGRTGAN